MRLTPLVVMLALTGCATTPAVRPSLQPLDTGLTRPCQAAPQLPSTAAAAGLSERQTVEIIGRYHGALADCSRRQAAIVDIYQRRDAAIGGGK